MIVLGDCRDTMRRWIADGVKVQMCCTSPPYWGLRDYGTAEWEGGDATCDHKPPAPKMRKFTNGRGEGIDDKYAGSNLTSWTYRDATPRECGCGARRIDRQLGLEPTPAEYVANMVEVFGLVRELLADDGVLWLNLGDSYATGAGKVGERPGGGEQGDNWQGAMTSPNRMPIAGLKPKDLVGIPWSVAKALQAPRYTGRIKSEVDRAWLAAIIDGEGCFFIHKRKAGTLSGSRFTRADGTEVNYERTADTYGVGLEIANTSLAIIERVQQIVGGGTITTQSPEQNNRRKQTIYRWRVQPNECKRLAQELYPHLIAKQHQARLIFNCPSSGEPGAAAHAAMMGLHRGSPTDIDYPAPPSMFTPGWFLRQDLIWSKPNCMPESVTDRCTKSHEYIFLLSKSERYFFDAAAIQEPFAYSGDIRMKTAYAEETGKSVGSEYKARVNQDGRNRRSVWTIATQPYSEAHFATFPRALVEPCIMAGSRVGDTVLDPFMGSGTVGQVAQDLGRKWLGCELNADYIKLADRRTAQQAMVLEATD